MRDETVVFERIRRETPEEHNKTPQERERERERERESLYCVNVLSRQKRTTMCIRNGPKK
jgi:hypothetical protein